MTTKPKSSVALQLDLLLADWDANRRLLIAILNQKDAIKNVHLLSTLRAAAIQYERISAHQEALRNEREA